MAHTATNLPGGLGSLFQFGVESAYGTKVATTVSLPILPGESLKPVRLIKRPASIRQGRYGPRSDFRVPVARGGDGGFGIEANVVALGKLLRWMVGGTSSSAQQGGTIAYLQTHQSGRMNTTGTNLTIQKGVATEAGVVEPMTLTSCKCKSWEFGCEPDGIAFFNFDADAQVAEHTTDLEAAAYPTLGNVFHWDQCTVKRAGSALPGVAGISIRGDNALNTERYRADGTGKKREPVESNLRSVELTLDVEFGDLTKTWDDILTDATVAWVVEFVGANIASTYYETLRFTITAGKLKEDTEFPTVSSEEAPLSQSVVIESVDDGTNPLVKVELITTDAAI